MSKAYIVSALRSPVGRAFKGTLSTKRPDDLCADVIRAVMAQVPGADPALVDDVIVGCAMPEAEQGMNVARFAGLLADLPDTVPGVTVNRFCSSGLQTIAMAAYQINAGAAHCILAGGTESMTMIPMMGNKVVGSRTIMSSGQDREDYYLGMGLTAENVAKDFEVSREEQDRFSFESHQKAVNALKQGYFKDETVAIKVTSRRPAEGGMVDVKEGALEMDEGPRADTSVEALGKLRAAFKTGGSVTAGNSSQMSDGAAMCMVVSEEFMNKYQLTPLARFVSFSVAGVPPRVMGIGPVEAIPRALNQAGLNLSQMDHIELNEAFAAQSLAVLRKLDINPEVVNPHGGAIALGHPLGATGAKLTATLLHNLKRTQKKYGMVTMCIGTGMGACGIFEAM